MREQIKRIDFVSAFFKRVKINFEGDEDSYIGWANTSIDTYKFMKWELKRGNLTEEKYNLFIAEKLKKNAKTLELVHCIYGDEVNFSIFPNSSDEFRDKGIKLVIQYMKCVAVEYKQCIFCKHLMEVRYLGVCKECWGESKHPNWEM